MDDARKPRAAELFELAVRQIANHALTLSDAEGVIVAWLAGSERLFGYQEADVIGHKVDILFTPEDRAHDIPEWERKTAAASGEAEDDRWQMRKDGARVWVSGSMTPLRDEHGHLVGFAKVMRDRTDFKAHVEALQSRLGTLERSEETRRNFTATLAHELRSPLATISTAASMLEQRSGGAPELAFAAGSLRRQVDFMTRLVNDLLELTRFALGKAKLHTERVAVRDIVTEACEAASASIAQRRHRLHRLLPDATIYLLADAARLRQVFTNLIENACKYTPPGGDIWIKVTPEGSEAVIKVADNGIGIAPEVMPHIFELFTQAETDRDKRSGLGIGLAVVKDIVAMHGGTVQATSDGVNKGSEFTVRLPLPAQRGPLPGS